MTSEITINIRDRAVQAYHDALRRQWHEEAVQAEEEAERKTEALRLALKRYLDIDFACTDPEVELEGVRFTAVADWESRPVLYVVLPCEDCGQDTRTETTGWAQLGDVLSRPPFHRPCPAIPPRPQQTTPTVEERLVEALRELVREELRDV